MILGKKYLIASLILLFLAIPPIFLGISIYKPVLNSFPQIAELEIQDYYLTFSIIFSLYSLFLWFSFKKTIRNFFNLKDKVYVSIPFLLTVIFLEFSYILYFYKTAYPALLKTSDFRDVGIITEESLALPILFSIIILTSFIFLAFIKWVKIKFIFLFYLISLMLIVLLSFRMASLNHHDFAYFAGPINDILHGKYLLHNSPSQYGFLSIVFLSLIFKIIPLGLMNLTIVNAAIVTLGFILVFLLLQILYRNKLLSLFTIIFIIFLNHTVQIVPQITVLQTSFIRFGMWVFLALGICFDQLNNGVKYRKLAVIIPYFILALSFFWILDNGVYVLFAFLTYKIFNHLQQSFLKSVKSILFEFVKVGFSIGVVFAAVEIYYRLFFKFPPNWSYYASDPSLYLGGFGLIALPNSSWHWIIITGYLLMMIYFFVIKRFSKDCKISGKDNVISFILFYGIFQFSYYMGRSHLNNLHHVIVPFLICLFYLLENFLYKIKETNKRSYFFSGAFALSFLISLPLYFSFIQGSKNLTTYGFPTAFYNLKNREKIDKDYIDSTIGPSIVSQIREKYGDYIDRNGITLISMNDIWYLVRLKMVNNIESNNLRYYVREEPLQEIASSILSNNYQYIFVDIYMQEGFGQVERIYKKIKDKYIEKEQIGSLLVFERI